MHITIDFAVSRTAFARIEQMMADSVARDSDLSGVECVIEYGEFTAVECSDEIIAARILSAIHAELDGRRGVPAGYRMTALGNVFDAGE